MEEVTDKVKCDMAELGLRLWMHRNGSWPFLGLFSALLLGKGSGAEMKELASVKSREFLYIQR